jgi:DnaA regulatory inactivator Hda
MTETPQLALGFGHRPALSGEDFLVAPPNAEAVRWLDTWPDWPGPALVIFGPAGSGKTHLAQVFQATSRARLVTETALRQSSPPAIVGEAPAVVLENAEDILARGLEEPTLHLFNHIQEAGRHLLVTAKEPPSRWKLRLGDLASRMNAAPQAGIGPPEDTLIAALLVKQFSDRQLKVDEGVISFMVSHMERSFAAARSMVAAIDHLSLAERRNITVPLVRKVLKKTEE